MAEVRAGGAAPALCPSARATTDGAAAFGVIARNPDGERRVRWIERPVPVDDALLAAVGDAPPSHVLRIAGTCATAQCWHWDGRDCRLAARVATLLEPVADTPPACAIRPRCRWFAQEGRAACVRCPQIVTDDYEAGATMREVAAIPGR